MFELEVEVEAEAEDGEKVDGDGDVDVDEDETGMGKWIEGPPVGAVDDRAGCRSEGGRSGAASGSCWS